MGRLAALSLRCGGRVNSGAGQSGQRRDAVQQEAHQRRLPVDACLGEDRTQVHAYGIEAYAQCLCEFFEMLVRRKCSGYVDPCGIAGRIAASNTAAQREVLQRTALYALEHARSALAAEARRHHEEANRQWNLVFNATY